MTTTKEKIDEIDRITGSAGQSVQLGREGDNFTVSLPVGPNSPAIQESADSWDNALDKVLTRLRDASNTVSRENEAAYNLARTEAETAAKMGVPTPFQKAILAGKSLEEAHAEAGDGALTRAQAETQNAGDEAAARKKAADDEAARIAAAGAAQAASHRGGTRGGRRAVGSDD